MGHSCQLYALDNDGYFPENGSNSDGDSWDFVWVHPTTGQFFVDYLFPLDKEKSKELDNNILFCPTDRFVRAVYNSDDDWAFNGGLIGYYVFFGNDVQNLINDGNAAVGQCNVLEWASRKKLGGRYRKAPILADSLGSCIDNGSEEWDDEGVAYSNHASRKNFIPEGGFFLFEDGSVIWSSGLETEDGETSGEIGLGVIEGNGYWNIYCTLPGIR